MATNTARRYGRAKCGRRVRGAVPAGRWERLTVLGDFTLSGLSACLAVEGATDRAVMRAVVEHALVPTLRSAPARSWSWTTSRPIKTRACALIEADGCTLLSLPPFPPDLNLIESAWNKLKQSLRGPEARTLDALHAALTAVLGRITASDAAGYFRHCGYAR